MHLLVVHATKTGSTGELAGWIAEAIRAHGHRVTESPAATAPAPGGFDAVVVGSGIRAGHWHSPAVGWVSAHAEALHRLPVITFTGSLKAADPEPASIEEVAGYTTRVMEPLGIHPVAHGSLVGAYDPRKVSLPERLLMKALRRGAPADDRDPQTVRDWVADALAAIE